MKQETKMKMLEYGLLAFTIWCFVCAFLGIYAVFHIMGDNAGCNSTPGILVNLTYYNSTQSQIWDTGKGIQMIDYNIIVKTNESGIIKTYPIMQNSSEGYLRERYIINQSYLVNTCDGIIRGLINDNKFNRWIT